MVEEKHLFPQQHKIKVHHEGALAPRLLIVTAGHLLLVGGGVVALSVVGCVDALLRVLGHVTALSLWCLLELTC